jgi:CRP-like cAMP-binding protein
MEAHATNEPRARCVLGKSEWGDNTTNRILNALSFKTRRKLWPMLDRSSTVAGEVLFDVGAPVTYLYFVERGLVSLVKRMEDGKSLEVGSVGTEGVSTPNAIFGADRAIVESIVQIPGIVLRIKRDDFTKFLDEDRNFRHIIHAYISVALNQLAQVAACNAMHSLEERCARWLLIGRDNALSETFTVTHDALAGALGVRRASVSVAAAALQKAGFISYARGNVTILDRSGLHAVACECYPTIIRQLDELFLRHEQKAV